MHNHDLDLIAALADGSLEDETRALSRVDSCADCRVEYETQKSVLAALQTVGPATMTDHEKAALHRDLWTDLRAGGPVPRSTVPWWYRWSYAAAGLFVVVGLVAVISQMADDGDSSAEFDETAETLSASGDAPAADDESAAADGVSTEPLGEQSAAEAVDAGGVDSAAALVDFDELANTLIATPQARGALDTADQSVYTDCLSEAGLEDHTVLETYSLEAGDYIAVSASDAPADSADISFVDLATCEIVYTDR